MHNEEPNQAWPQYFITRIVGGRLPDVEILTLPGQDLSAESARLFRLFMAESPLRSAASDLLPASIAFESDCRSALRALIEAPFRGSVMQAGGTRQYVDAIYSEYPIPVMHSPISGSTLAELAKVGAPCLGYMAFVPHPSLGNAAVYFLMLGGTKIVMGAADGVSAGLKHGLENTILRWFRMSERHRNKKKTHDSSDEDAVN